MRWTCGGTKRSGRFVAKAATKTTENEVNPALDWIKWGVVAVLVVGGVVGNWYFQDQSVLARAIALVALAAVAGFVGLQTDRGRALLEVAREARQEIRRVVWPTRQETTQTTFVVLALIVLFALILWGLDSLLSWLVQGVIG